MSDSKTVKEPMNNNRITLRDLYEQIEKLEGKMEANYVHKSEFAPVKQLVFGLVGLVLITVATIVLNVTLGVNAIW